MPMVAPVVLTIAFPARVALEAPVHDGAVGELPVQRVQRDLSSRQYGPCRRGCCSQRSPLSPGAQVSKVARSDLKSFKLELHPGSRHAKAAKSAGGSASLLFSSDDNTEISKWVNDLTKVVSGLHGGH